MTSMGASGPDALDRLRRLTAARVRVSARTDVLGLRSLDLATGAAEALASVARASRQEVVVLGRGRFLLTDEQRAAVASRRSTVRDDLQRSRQSRRRRTAPVPAPAALPLAPPRTARQILVPASI